MEQNNQIRKYHRNYTKQWIRIYDCLCSTQTHPTALWIYNQLKDEFNGLSPGTVYRNLNKMVEKGLILRLDFADSASHYDGTIQPHYHFFCNSCQNIIDIPMDYRSDLNKKVKEITGHQVQHHRIDFIGICKNCLV